MSKNPIIWKLRYTIANWIAWVYEKIRPKSENEPDLKILRASFEAGGGLDLTVQSEAAKFLAFCMMQMVGDAPNYVTSGFGLKAMHEWEMFEMTVRRVPCKKLPVDRIRELEEEVDRLKSLIPA